MFRVINEYLTKVNLQSDDSIYHRIDNFLSKQEEIKKYTVTLNVNRYVVDIKLNTFQIEMVEQCFHDFVGAVSYPYSSMHVRFNEGKCVRYRFLTSKEDKDAFYCDIIFQ